MFQLSGFYCMDLTVERLGLGLGILSSAFWKVKVSHGSLTEYLEGHTLPLYKVTQFYG